MSKASRARRRCGARHGEKRSLAQALASFATGHHRQVIIVQGRYDVLPHKSAELGEQQPGPLETVQVKHTRHQCLVYTYMSTNQTLPSFTMLQEPCPAPFRLDTGVRSGKVSVQANTWRC